MNGYLIKLDKDSHMRRDKYYWLLYRVIENTPSSEPVAKGSLGEIARYLFQAFKRSQYGKDKREKMRKFEHDFE
jgi:hypothetical protein